MARIDSCVYLRSLASKNKANLSTPLKTCHELSSLLNLEADFSTSAFITTSYTLNHVTTAFVKEKPLILRNIGKNLHVLFVFCTLSVYAPNA